MKTPIWIDVVTLGLRCKCCNERKVVIILTNDFWVCKTCMKYFISIIKKVEADE